MYTEKRKTRRFMANGDVYYCRCFYDTEFVPRWSREIQTQSLNESSRGICILSGRHYPTGTRLRMRSQNWTASREGTVQWCKSFAVGRFRVGLSMR